MRKVTPAEVITQKLHIRYIEPLRNVSRINRKKPTRTENIFWYEILNKNKTGFKFTRQKPIDRFVLDFYCSKLLMAIEIDGGSHETKKEHDLERDKYLEKFGIITIRYKVEDVIKFLPKIREDLASTIAKRKCELKLPCQGEVVRDSGPEGFVLGAKVRLL